MRSIKLIILLIIIAPLMMSFSFFGLIKSRDYEDMANEISAKVAKKLTKKHQMDWVGEGGGMMKTVNMIGLSFQIHHAMEREEARARIVDCVEELLAAVNANEEIRPYLKNYPFTTKNVEVVIFIESAGGKELFDPDIRVVSVDENDAITYRTQDPTPNKRAYKHRYKESYSEALAIVRGRQKEARQHEMTPKECFNSMQNTIELRL